MEGNAENGIRFLNRDMIKGIALVTMALNHFSYLFLYDGVYPDTWPAFALGYIGYFTAPVMIFFLVEGYSYTRSKRKYLGRLLFGGVISQIPFGLLCTRGKSFFYPEFNMMFTLSLCFCVVWVADRVDPRPLKVTLILVLDCLMLLCDWHIPAAAFVLLFIWAGRDRKKQAAAFAASVLVLIAVDLVLSPRWVLAVSPASFCACVLLYLSGIGLAAVCIVFFYNGRKSPRGGRFLQWFFYLFYPLHILALTAARMAWS